MLSDAHAHLTGFRDIGAADPARAREVVQRAMEKGVVLIVAVAGDLESSAMNARLAAEMEIVYGAVGFHPWVTPAIDRQTYRRLLALARKPKIVAVSEIGLDGVRSQVPKEVQLQALGQELRLAREAGLPVMVHDRGYHQELIDLLAKEAVPSGAIHGFTGSEEELKDWLDLGFHVSIGRPILQPDGEQLKSVVQKIPQERLLLETDAVPYSPSQGGRAIEPAILPQVAEKVALWRNTSVEDLGATTTDNLRHLLSL